MKKKSISHSAFFNVRILIGLFVVLAGVSLALVSFGTFSSVLAQNGTTREQMTVYLGKALAVEPPPCVPGQEMFNDVPASSPFCPWIEELSRRGITTGCAPNLFCPFASVTRQQMAVFLVKVLDSHDIGTNNVATGFGALSSNTTGEDNTAVGHSALASNTEGFQNTATGANALLTNTVGDQNSAFGRSALASNITGSSNTATGLSALFSNFIGNSNTATGVNALFSNFDGTANTATGFGALSSNTSGNDNTAIGLDALLLNTTGHQNTAIGPAAGIAQTTGSNNVYIGVAMAGVAGESNACYIASIFGQTSTGGTQVFINSNGKLGTTTSSRRFKEEIQPMEEASQIILGLRPVSFRYKSEIDPAGTRQFGLVAEEVEKLSPDLIVRDKEGKPYSVRYDQINAMLLNEFLKEHKKIEALKKDFQATIAEQQKQIQVLTAQLKEQAAKIQRVSAELEVSKPAPQMVLNDQ